MEAQEKVYTLGKNGKRPLSTRLSEVKGIRWLLMALPAAYVVLTMGIAMVSIFQKSVISKQGFTFDYFKKVFTEPLYINVLLETLKTGVIVTFTTLLLAYPMAYLSVRAKKKWIKNVVTGGVLIPYWISMLVRIFAWQIILSKEGLVNKALMAMGIIDKPLTILYTGIAVVISLTHILLPNMFLSLQAKMEGIDENLTRAADGMGAHPVRNFFDIFFPLSLQGIVSGCLMVFVLALGFYIAPALLGGANNMMVSNLIEDNMNNFNWGVACAQSIQLLLIVFVIIAVAFKFVGNIFIPKK